jgi:hypothetical protein
MSGALKLYSQGLHREHTLLEAWCCVPSSGHRLSSQALCNPVGAGSIILFVNSMFTEASRELVGYPRRSGESSRGLAHLIFDLAELLFDILLCPRRKGCERGTVRTMSAFLKLRTPTGGQ